MLWEKQITAGGSVSFEPTSLYYLTGLDLVESVQLNNAGEVLFTAINENLEIQPYLLTTARLGVDFDRDGRIDTSRDAANPDRTLARKGMPWYFWINDDNDANETDGNDIPGAGGNGRDGVVNGVRVATTGIGGTAI